MIIDFHTHIFPDSIAEKTISKLASMIDEKPYSDGTLEGLKKSMKQAGVDYSVILPVVTRPQQFESVNDFAASITGKDGIISFGGVHPKAEDYKDEINKIIELGLKGIKLHPDFQDTFIDEPCSIDLISYALEKGLIVSVHAGMDAGLPDPVHCPPDKALHMIKKVQERVDTEKLILAHTGGHMMWDDVENYLVGENIFLDISFSRKEMSVEQMIRIIKKHGADRILFGSDSPWDGQLETVEYVKSLPLSKEEIDKILGENAKRICMNGI